MKLTDYNPHGATVVFGGQVGSEGKGAIVGYLARRRRYGGAICTFMTNAGHTWQEGNEKIVVQQLPVSIVAPHIRHIMIGPSSAIYLPQLEKELDLYGSLYNVPDRLKIDPRAMIIEDSDAQLEAKITKRVASTMKGCGSALARKAMRHPTVNLARDVNWLKPFLDDTVGLSNHYVERGLGLMVEGSQGFDLDIHHGLDYPTCTSRQTTPMQVMADIGIDGAFATEIVAVIRSYPIRVGNVTEGGIEVGNSGGFGGKELTWEEVTKQSGYATPLEERTTVTQRVRRVFEMDFERLGRMARVTRPTDIALTFADYIDYNLLALNQYNGESEKLNAFIARVDRAVGFYARSGNSASRVSMVKTGPDDSHTFEL